MEYSKKLILPDQPKTCPLMYTPCDLTWAAVQQFVVDLRAMCPLAGREDFLQENSVWLQEPQRWPFLLPRVWHSCHQPVPGPDRAQTLPQRGQLDLQLPAVPLPGMNKAFWIGVRIIGVMTFSRTDLEAGSWLFLHLRFRLGVVIKHLQSPRELKAPPSVFTLTAE